TLLLTPFLSFSNHHYFRVFMELVKFTYFCKIDTRILILLKNIFIYFLLTAILTQSFEVIITIFEFQSNRTFYEKVLCINKNKPELACHGKCVLMQKLKHEYEKNNDSERQALQNLFDRKVTLYCCDLLTTFKVTAEIPKLNPSMETYTCSQYNSSFFHPPLV
ncbi:MAG: hypothetical protein ABI761_20195, partial [Saprospiraceae bacterium]